MAKLNARRIAIAGGNSLIGREVRELLSDVKPAISMELVSGDLAGAKIASGDEGDAVVLSPMNAESLAGVSAVVLAGTPESSLRALELTARSLTPLIDLTTALEDQPNARLRSPLLGPAAPPGIRNIHIVAHPAATLLALFFNRIAGKWPIRQSVVVLFEPASERGEAGLRELQAQSVNLLSFKPLPKDIFDAQAGFNLLPALGAEAPLPLSRIEAAIDRHLATLLFASGGAPMPSLRLVQAPVFHGYSGSVWVEFGSAPSVEDLEGALASAQIDVRTPDEEPPSNVGAAGMSGLTVGDVRKDRNNPRAFWFWLAADNVRTYAETAVAVLKECL